MRVLAAGGTAGEMGAHSRCRRVGVVSCDLLLDVAVEQVEALVAVDLVALGAEQCRHDLRSRMSWCGLLTVQ